LGQPLPKHADLPGESEGEAEAAADYFESWDRLLGDTADRISDHAHCGMLIVK